MRAFHPVVPHPHLPSQMLAKPCSSCHASPCIWGWRPPLGSLVSHTLTSLPPGRAPQPHPGGAELVSMAGGGRALKALGVASALGAGAQQSFCRMAASCLGTDRLSLSLTGILINPCRQRPHSQITEQPYVSQPRWASPIFRSLLGEQEHAEQETRRLKLTYPVRTCARGVLGCLQVRAHLQSQQGPVLTRKLRHI